MKKILMYLALFFASGTIITIVGLKILDNFIYSLSQTSTIVTADKTNTKEEIQLSQKIDIDTDIQDIQYSYNNKYYTYLKDSKIYINTISDGKNLDIIQNEQNIVYYHLLYDKNLIMYFTEQKNGNMSKIVLNTYEIDTKRETKYNSFNVQNFVKIKDMNMSPIINIIYINVESRQGNSTINTIYSINLFESMSKVKTGVIIDKMIMLQHKNTVYYQDNKNNIYMGNYKINLFKEPVEMVGLDDDDNLYFISKNKKDKIFIVKNNKIIKTIELSDTDIIDTYSNYKGVYLIYPTYVMNVAGDDPYKRIGKFSKYVEFEAIKDNLMYLRMKDNILIKTKLLEN
ncbi:MAG: hypothetical protein RSB67_00190 [Clostridia bacterium]